MKALLNDAAARATRYLDDLHDRRVSPSPSSLQQLSELDQPLPEQPTTPEAVLETLDRIGSPATVANAGGRFFGFVLGGSLPAALAANWLSGAWDQCPGLFAASPIC